MPARSPASRSSSTTTVSPAAALFFCRRSMTADNKTFWYANFERTKLKDYRSTAFSTLPTTQFKQGDFSQLLNPAFTGDVRSGTTIGTDALGRPIVFGAIYDPTTARQVNGQWVRDPFPGNMIPTGAVQHDRRNISAAGPDHRSRVQHDAAQHSDPGRVLPGVRREDDHRSRAIRSSTRISGLR